MDKKNINNLSAAAVSTIIYTGFAFYIYKPHLANYDNLQWLLPTNSIIAALGCYTLSRRWIYAYAGSFFAGLIFGFSPYMLSLAQYHPTAGTIAAIVPWLFWPAAYIGKKNYRWISLSLVLLPFLVILLLFRISACNRLFPLPLQAGLKIKDLLGLVAPVVIAQTQTTSIGFYHVAVVPLVMGFCMIISSRRYIIMLITISGFALAVFKPVQEISPLIWPAISLSCCSVLIGVGLQALATAGYNDRKWLLFIIIVTFVFATAAFLLAIHYFQTFLSLADSYAKLFAQEGMLLVFGALTAGIFYFILRAKLRYHWIRWLILCAAMTIDIFLGATLIVDKIM